MIPYILLIGIFCFFSTGVLAFESPEDFSKIEHRHQYLGNEFFQYVPVVPDPKPNEDPNIQLCHKQLNEIKNGLRIKQMWALEVIDAWGKLPSGILWGHYSEFGGFDQCLATSKTFPNSGYYKGQYCLAQIAFKELLPILPTTKDVNPNLFQRFSGLSIGTCVPNVCKTSIIDKLMKDTIKEHLNLTISDKTTIISKQNCRVSDPIPFEPIDYFAITIFAVIGLFMTISTIYDYWSKDGEQSQLFLAFSVRTNCIKLFKMPQNQDSSKSIIESLNGIRCLTILWVALIHEYSFGSALNYINKKLLLEWMTTPFSMLIQNASQSVDTFMVLSGCLLAWTAMKEMEKRNGKLNIPLMYLHRYLRLTPVYAIAILFMVSLYKFFGNGPLWHLNYNESCQKNWWASLLYVHNYVNFNDMCLKHTWYLAVDVQLYLISPLLLIPLWKFGIKFFIVLIIAVLCSMAYVMAIFLHFGYNMVFLEQGIEDEKKMELLYFGTQARFGAWLIGLMLGYYLYMIRNRKIHLKKKIILIGWCISIGIILTCLFGPYHRFKMAPKSGATSIEGGFYEAFSRPAWGLAISWIIFACHIGYGGIINTILTCGLWKILARIQYSFYIWHLIVQLILLGNSRVDAYFSDIDVFLRFSGSVLYSMFVSIIVVLAFESPILVLEKIIFKGKRGNESPSRA